MQLGPILERLDLERRRLGRDGEVLEILPNLTRLRMGDGALHSIIYSSLSDANADAIIAGQVEHYRTLGVEVEWKLYSHDAPADLRARLARHRFVAGPMEAVLVLDLQDAPSWIYEDAGRDVTRVSSIEHVALFRAAAEHIFGKDYAFTAGELSRGIEKGLTDHLGYLLMEEGRAVSIGRLYTHPESAFGGLYGGGTLASHRGRGLYRALVAARARDAAKLGARYLQVDALPSSRPILQRLGFVHLTDTWPCVWTPSQTKVIDL